RTGQGGGPIGCTAVPENLYYERACRAKSSFRGELREHQTFLLCRSTQCESWRQTHPPASFPALSIHQTRSAPSFGPPVWSLSAESPWELVQPPRCPSGSDSIRQSFIRKLISGIPI